LDNTKNIRQRTEIKEESLSPFAQRSRLSLGRAVFEEPCALRTDFVRDRDRIIHCKAFRRLKHKTQVFMAPEGDHFVTRLTHTLEVSQIARTIARALNLNEDLTEAISLGHDLGHTPFGHIGERALSEMLEENFRHNEQSLRVVDLLEKNGKGLNLTLETRDGILHHSKSKVDMAEAHSQDAKTLEGQICKIADAVAYINHDLGDALRAGIFKENELPKESIKVLGSHHSQRINALVTDIVYTSWDATGENGLDVKPYIHMSLQVASAANALRDFLFERVYMRSDNNETHYKDIVAAIFQYYLKHPQEIPAEYFIHAPHHNKRAVADFIAGMTDNYALCTYNKLRLV